MAEARKEFVGSLLVVLGILLMIIGITADAIGIGVGGGIGYKQILVTLVGVAAVLAGIRPCYCAHE